MCALKKVLLVFNFISNYRSAQKNSVTLKLAIKVKGEKGCFKTYFESFKKRFIEPFCH